MNLDRLITAFDNGLRTLAAIQSQARPRPDEHIAETGLEDREKQLSAALMRVNHSGEICAQALYQAQALVARDARVRATLKRAAVEEADHLAWTAQRIAELGGRTSLLNPLWYIGSFGLGVAAAMLGDKWNLGFLAETERQVEGHLDGHLERIPAQDQKTRVLLEQMKKDEARHARSALEHGAAPLPDAAKRAMAMGSRLMTGSTYWI